MQKKTGRKLRVRYFILILAGVVFYLLLGATLPFLRHPDVSRKTKEEFRKKDFYGTSDHKERAGIISDNGEALAERIRLIEEAVETIEFSTFEIHSDSSGKQVMAALKKAAERGVRVRLIADGFPSPTMHGNTHFPA